MKNVLLFTSLLLVSFLANSQKNANLQEGKWIGSLQLNDTTILRFDFIISNKQDIVTFTVINGDEEIELTEGILVNETFHYKFPVFNTELNFAVNSKSKISGFWINPLKENYSIPFTGEYSEDNRFEKTTNSKPLNFDGKWETMFMKDGNDEYPALGIFQQNSTNIVGTFLTETGDYRYLDGNVYGNELYLSCFDGSHAFLFTAKQNEQGNLEGNFYSGTHWKGEWRATRNDLFELANPDSITYVKDIETKLTFQLPTIDGDLYSYPNIETKGKVVIIQILGTWCPNCMDETKYFKELYNKYHKDGLEIISVGYEASKDPLKQSAALKSYREKLDLSFTFLVGGAASKDAATEDFPILSNIVSFPTSIFISRDGVIQRIHTGFNGPSTGKYYEQYIQKTEMLIKEMLAN